MTGIDRDIYNIGAHLADSARQMREARDLEIERQARNAGRYDASAIFKHLAQRLKQFQKSLGENEEIGIRLANFGEVSQINIRSIGYKDPNLMEFLGVNPDGHEVTLVQHISQLNFLLVAVKPIEEKPYRIGF